MRLVNLYFAVLAFIFSATSFAEETTEVLYKAVQSGHLEILKAKVDAGADLGGSYPLRNGEIGTLLHVAVEENHIDIVGYLLDKGLFIEARTARSPGNGEPAGRTPLTIAAGSDSIQIVELLIERGACLDPYSASGLPLLHPAITPLSYRVKQCIESARKAQSRALATAPWKDMVDADGRVDQTTFLEYLANGGACEGTDKMGNTVIHHLAAIGTGPTLSQVLNQNNVNLNAVNMEGQTALHAAARMYNSAAIQVLLDHGAHVNARDVYGKTPLLMFGSVTSDLKGIAQAFSVLIQNGADIKATDVFGRNILFKQLGYVNQHAEATLLLLKAGADANCQSDEGKTPLHMACDKGELEVVRVLLDSGANPDLKDIDGHGPEYFVRYEQKQDIWNLLFARKKNVTVQQAVYYYQPDILTKLVAPGKTIDEIAVYGDRAEKQDFSFYDSLSFSQAQTCLSIAARLDDPKRIELVLSFGADVNGTDPASNTALHWAAFGGYTRAVEALLKAGADVTLKNNNGQTAYDGAVKNKHNRAVQLITDYCPDFVASQKNPSAGQASSSAAVSQQAKSPLPSENKAFEADIKNAPLQDKVKELAANSAKPLHTAVILNKPDFVKTLLQKEPALANEPDARGILPVGYAAVLGYRQMVELLIENGADINGLDHAVPEILGTYSPRGHTVDAETGWGVLHYLVMTEDLEMLKFVIARGADPEVKDREQGMSPFILAMELENYEAAKILAGTGADINQFDRDGNAAIHVASRGKHQDRIERLLGLGVSIDARNRSGRTPLIMAAGWQSNDLIVWLVEHGADINATDNGGSTALHAAGYDDDIYETVRILLEYGADVNHKNKSGRTPVFSMCCSYCTMGPEVFESVRLMIEFGADLSIQDNQGDTVLHEAIRNSKLDFALLLIEEGVNVNVVNADGVSALRLLLDPSGFPLDKTAALNVLNKLADKGADLSALDAQGRTAVHDTLEREWMPAFSCLVEKGAPINVQDNRGRSALHAAVEKNNAEAAKLLIAAGADVNLQDKQGNTPLHAAVTRENVKMAQMLLDAGARSDIPDHSKKTAVDRAKMIQNPVIKALFAESKSF